jgi:hypothetical protein
MSLGVTEISAILAAAGVLAGVVYYILDMRRQTEIKTIDLALRLDAIWESKDFVEWWVTFQERDPKEYDTLTKENQRKWIPEKQILGFYVTPSFLLRKKLVDLETCSLFPILYSWEKLQFYVEKVRRGHNQPRAYEEVDYLIDEIKKREQKLQQSKV